MARIPTLGPRGEGWFLLQVLLLLAISVATWQAPGPGAGTDTVAVAAGRALGAFVGLAALALVGLGIAFLQRGQALSALPRPLETGSLVAAGPYRLVRHPIYSGLILGALGIALVRMSVVVAVLAIALAVVLDLKRRREEAWLVGRYPGYAAYMTRTRAFVPFLY